jgi:hypothetical protein
MGSAARPRRNAELTEEISLRHSFWMYSYQHRYNFGDSPKPGLAKWFNPLGSLPVLVGFTTFDKLRAALGFKTSAMLMIGKKR